MPVIEGARYRTGTEAGVSSDPSGYGPEVYSGTATGGTPAAGTAGFGAGTLQPGALVIATQTATPKLFINTNTKASPTWTVVGAQS
jgi:hypothetical protein